ncbi:MAG: hypothetical protein R2709_01765 [Marmoricola sp.]
MSGYAEAVTAWLEHLRGGGTSGRDDFTAQAALTDRTSTDHRHHEQLPTATQLRLLQLLLPMTDRPDLLTDLVTNTPAPGRGLVDIPLTWPARVRSALLRTHLLMCPQTRCCDRPWGCSPYSCMEHHPQPQMSRLPPQPHCPGASDSWRTALPSRLASYARS